jgi:hypothetical protein
MAYIRGMSGGKKLGDMSVIGGRTNIHISQVERRERLKITYDIRTNH